jgi:monofunctional biosynthetic peptidoglycan transglycosylase
MKAVLRLVACLAVAALALELFFVVRIAAMAVIDPQSTAFQRSEAWQVAIHKGSEGGWRRNGCRMRRSTTRSSAR